MVLRFFAWLSTLLVAGAAVADEGSLQRCVGIADPEARLACFDSVASATTPEALAAHSSKELATPSVSPATARNAGAPESAAVAAIRDDPGVSRRAFLGGAHHAAWRARSER